VHEALTRYRRVLAAETDPDERAAGLREWGTGEARIAEARVVGSEGADRRQFLAGEPLSLRLRIESGPHVPPPRLQLELRDDAGLLVAGDAVDAAELGWRPGDGEQLVRYDVERLPLGEGRFHLRLGLADATSDRLLHLLDDALVFVVVPAGEERGVVRLEGSWALEEKTQTR
jgi:hypothetical protein